MAKLPIPFVEAVISRLNRGWDAAWAYTTSQGARAEVQASLTRSLHAGDQGAVPLDYIVAMAKAGHEPAQWALRKFIRNEINERQFNDLPVSLQHYNMDVLENVTLPGYARGNKIVDTWTRDIVIIYLTKVAIAQWGVKKAQAAYLVALVLKRRGIKPGSAKQVLDIFNNRDTLHERLVRFLLAEIPDDGPPAIASPV